MRPLILLSVSLAALAAGCSEAASDAMEGADRSFESELELALFGGAEATTPVLSELELHRPEESLPAPASVPREQEPPAPIPETPSLLGQPVAELAGADAPAVAVAGAPGEIELTPVAVADAGANADDGRAADAPRPATGGRTIIIRGGVSGRDPCKLHLPGAGGIAGVFSPDGARGVLGTVGVMVNDRTPPLPNARGRMPSRTRAPSPMGGSVFAGGIR
jgi:hypothetical protein